MKALIVEDDRVTATFLKRSLEEEGFSIDLVSDGNEALELARINEDIYDIIILDILLPGTDGVQICSNLRQEGNKTPILMLSGRDHTEQKIEGLNAGADDYLTKPFEVTELLARIKAIQRRAYGIDTGNIIKIRNIELDQAAHEVRVEGKAINLSPIEYRILNILMENKGNVLTRSVIIEKVWDTHYADLFSNSVNVHIRNIRKKLGDNDNDNPMVITVRGAGYKFALE
jgi:two-component system OmpR family response regulator